jgi:hypothetical protein
MLYEKDIRRAVRHKVAKDTLTNKTTEDIDNIVLRVQSDIKSLNYDFAKFNSIALSQNGKKRFVKEYEDVYSTESILCQCIKQILDRVFRVKYPNRNKSVRELFNVLTAIRQMGGFTIVKFDFKDYFNSVSVPYVLEKYIKPRMTNRFEIDVISEFANKTRYAYAGLGTSNAIAEIIAKNFDDSVKMAFASLGVLFYERYIDDGIIIFNENVKRDEIETVLNTALESIYRDDAIDELPKCKTRFNIDKFFYATKQDLTTAPVSFDFLGYEISLTSANGKVDIMYGITQSKQDKYKKRVARFISLYVDPASPDYNKLELLRHRLVTFTSRAVYQGKKYNSKVWKVKGFVANYGELRYLLKVGLVNSATENYLRSMVEDAFSEAGVNVPYFIKNSQNKVGYNLLENMKKNKTLLLVDRIGFDYDALAKLCNKIDSNKRHCTKPLKHQI